MSPYMTQYTREMHDGKKDPQRNMANRKPMIGSGKTPYTGARMARTIESLRARVVEHPADAMAAARLAGLGG